MRSELVHTVNCSIQNNLSQEKRMLPTITPGVTTQLERKLLIWFWTEPVNWLTNVPVSRDSSSSTALVVEPDQDLHHSSWNVLVLIMERNQNWNSPSTQHPKSPLPS